MVKFLIDNKGIFKSKAAKVVAGILAVLTIIKVVKFVKEPSLSYEDEGDEEFDRGEYIDEDDD